mgnify:CR=1 FL=1
MQCFPVIFLARERDFLCEADFCGLFQIPVDQYSLSPRCPQFDVQMLSNLSSSSSSLSRSSSLSLSSSSSSSSSSPPPSSSSPPSGPPSWMMCVKVDGHVVHLLTIESESQITVHVSLMALLKLDCHGNENRTNNVSKPPKKRAKISGDVKPHRNFITREKLKQKKKELKDNGWTVANFTKPIPEVTEREIMGPPTSEEVFSTFKSDAFGWVHSRAKEITLVQLNPPGRIVESSSRIYDILGKLSSCNPSHYCNQIVLLRREEVSSNIVLRRKTPAPVEVDYDQVLRAYGSIRSTRHLVAGHSSANVSPHARRSVVNLLAHLSRNGQLGQLCSRYGRVPICRKFSCTFLPFLYLLPLFSPFHFCIRFFSTNPFIFLNH